MIVRTLEQSRRLLGLLPEVIWPRVCAGCGERGRWVCDPCWARVPLAAEPWCPRCGSRVCQCERLPSGYSVVRSAGPHAGWLEDAVHALKYDDDRVRSGHLGTLLAPALAELLAAEPHALVVPVPLHRGRQRERGFNQSHVLALAGLRAVGRPDALRPEVLRRVRVTRQQVGLDATERIQNVQGAFGAEAGQVAARPIIVVDDVLTTGSTLAACAFALRDAGAADVAAVTLTRAEWTVDHWR